jgi:GNAT superfamily N-acetyltransferase
MDQVTFRPGTIEDSYTCSQIFQDTLLDLGQRQGVMTITGGQDPAVLATLWETRRSLYEHLARSAEHFWLAEKEGRVIGYARSVLRDGLRMLTEYFVLPGEQGAGVGGELLQRAFPTEGARRRAIIATTDTRALRRYLKIGVYPSFPVLGFSRSPRRVAVDAGLTYEKISASPQTLSILGNLDQAILGFRREVDHAWLLEDRQGYLYIRARQPVGYGYIGLRNGPFALLDDKDFPAVLAHAESQASALGGEFYVEVPLANRAAVQYLLQRSYKISEFTAYLMCDEPFGRFENYLVTSPPFFI